MSRGQILTLRDGRSLGWSASGAPDGAPVLLFHGTPGSRLGFADDDPAARDLGLRLIATDRPGYGLSTPRPRRSFADWADDVGELADSLGLERFRILSVSGGGPFALACGARLGRARVEAIAVVSGPAPPDVSRRGMAPANRIGFFLAGTLGRARWLMRLLLGPTARLIREEPARYFERMERELGPPDRALARDPAFREQLRRELLEAFRHGVEGLLDESVRLTRAWGFALESIAPPVRLWHGEEDTLAPVAMARELERRIPAARLHVVPGHGHFLTDDPRIWRRILETLLEARASG